MSAPICSPLTSFTPLARPLSARLNRMRVIGLCQNAACFSYLRMQLIALHPPEPGDD
jgi:hypothetical protein